MTGQHGRSKPQTGLRQTNHRDVYGFLLHSSLVIDTNSETALGSSYIKAWERKENRLGKHEWGYEHLPLEEKESYKWVEAVPQSKELFGSANSITVVADRESDIYDLLCLKDEKLHLLVRSQHDRKLAGGAH